MQKYFTEQRRIISEYLESRKDECVTAQEIAAALCLSVSKSAVYRNLAALEKEGKVVRVSLAGDRAFGYRYAGSHACAGKIHISCVKCGRTEHVSSSVTSRLERALAAEEGFSLRKGECMLYGVCKACRGGASK
ncbi:MAG: transcriptional repressor [Clostridia bacterium]|nr:transcriptional repressor [Clostridia bacterium]